MPTQSQVDSIAARIHAAAVQGTPKNPDGLPGSLPDLLVAQSKHESGNYSSGAFTAGLNAFGYSYVPGGAWQLATPGKIADNGAPLARYASVENSTREIVDWIYRRRSEGKFPADLQGIHTPDQYGALLKSAGYYQDTQANYVNGLKRYFKPILVGTTSALGALVIIGALVWMVNRKKRA